MVKYIAVGRVAQLVKRLATGWTVRGSNPGGVRFSAPVQTGPGAHPASYTMGTESFPRVESGRVVTLSPHHLLVPWSKNSRAILVLSLRTFVACKKGETFLSIHSSVIDFRSAMFTSSILIYSRRQTRDHALAT
jgi:hypothetical protein